MSITFGALFVIGLISTYQAVYKMDIVKTEKLIFEIKSGESVGDFATRLESEKIIQKADLLKLYLQWKGLDTKIQTGTFELASPITIARIADTLISPVVKERSITLIPGWNLRDMAAYFEKEGIASSTDFFALTGNPATLMNSSSSLEFDISLLKNKPNVSLEGYFAPETYRIFADEKIESILKRLLKQREADFTVQMLEDIQKQDKTVHEILTLASILEREVKTPEDRKKVADLFWRRIAEGMGLQADSTVHYLTAREGDVFTKQTERQIDSPWNTYKYRGLPPGPISNPSVSSILAAIYPEKNNAVYFLTDFEGNVIYSQTFDEHNRNVQKYLR
jgi:UPF0755 protein